MIAQWITVKIAKEKKPVVYQIYQHLMDRGDPLNDQVVRVTAARKFKDVADEWEFNADTFLPYAPVIIDRLMALVQEVELQETKMALLNTISSIVERMEHHVGMKYLGKYVTDIGRSLRMQTALSPFSHPYGSNPGKNIS